jgi:hypothetical protein
VSAWRLIGRRGAASRTVPSSAPSSTRLSRRTSYAWFSNTAPEQEGATPLYQRGGEGAFEVTGDASGAPHITKAKMIQEVKVP